MVGDDQDGAGLERRKELAVHRSAVDRDIGRVMIVEEERDQIEVAHILRQRVVERPE